jgi:hypothetical protein
MKWLSRINRRQHNGKANGFFRRNTGKRVNITG